MNEPMNLSALVAGTVRDGKKEQILFALLALGVVESLDGGVLGATDAVRLFFHAENCIFVRKRFRKGLADQIMSHGVQLPDLFEALPAEEANREFQRELMTMRTLCLKLLEGERLVA